MAKRKDIWNRVGGPRGYTYDVTGRSDCGQSQGGVIWVEVRFLHGRWQRRKTQANGRYCASGPIEYIDDDMGVELWDSVENS